MDERKMVDLCLDHGAHKAQLIDVNDITFEENLRSYCEVNQCGCFGTNYACPPHVGNIDEVVTEAKSYNKALVIQTVGTMEDSYDIDGMEKAHKYHNDVSNRIQKELSTDCEKHLDLRAGPCKVCETCTALNNEPCRYPDKKRASLEAYCINVTTLASTCNMQYHHGENTVTFFGAFLMH